MGQCLRESINAGVSLILAASINAEVSSREMTKIMCGRDQLTQAQEAQLREKQAQDGAVGNQH